MQIIIYTPVAAKQKRKYLFAIFFYTTQFAVEELEGLIVSSKM